MAASVVEHPWLGATSLLATQSEQVVGLVQHNHDHVEEEVRPWNLSIWYASFYLRSYSSECNLRKAMNL